MQRDAEGLDCNIGACLLANERNSGGRLRERDGIGGKSCRPKERILEKVREKKPFNKRRDTAKN